MLSAFLGAASFGISADEIDSVADLVIIQPDRDSQCRTLFKYFMKYLENGEYGKADSLTARIDSKKPGVVPYCNAMRSKYL